ncbi:MAG: tRNA preQ1(34) S-adenosylmethionine ribosyltransferase-isomerase QueA [Fuerstiella sp.]
MVTPDLDDISAWQYDLPAELIAARPAPRRDASRLMLVRRDTGTIEHCHTVDLPDLLNPKDRLVFNNTKVLPARLFGFRTSTGGRWEGLFLQEHPDGRWQITGQTRGKLQTGESLTLIKAGLLAAADAKPPENDVGPADTLELQLTERLDDGTWLAAPKPSAVWQDRATLDLLESFGTLPLPPYIGRKVADDNDRQRYQTIFARETGAIAAPTAGLHFTPELLNECRRQGVKSSEVTLHVGIGTFRPVSASRLSEHSMHAEWCCVSASAAQEIAATKSAGGQIVAVGTTSVRTLEAASQAGTLNEWQGHTNLFIRPGYQFRTVDRLLTNFHLPGSTLIVLVAALSGYDLVMEAYRKAVEAGYRFYSYGDAMLIL